MLALLTLIASASLAPPQVHPATAARAASARIVLHSCGAAGEQLASQSDRAWAAPDPALADHRALRAALHEPVPQAPAEIMIYAAGGHLATEEHSIVLERVADSTWVATAVGRGKIWQEDAPYYLLPRKQWTLPADKARRLDQILKDRCFYAEPTMFEGDRKEPPPLGALYVRLEVTSDGGTRSAGFLGGEAKGLTAELVELSLPK